MESVPEAARHVNPRQTSLFNGSDSSIVAISHCLLHHLLVGEVGAVRVGHDPRHIGLGSRSNELFLGTFGGRYSHRDEEELGSLEGVNQSLLIVIVHLSDLDALGKLALAPGAGDGSNGVFSGFEKLFGNVLANLAASLMGILLANHRICAAVQRYVARLTPTMATRSMRLVKPAGWSFAYLTDIVAKFRSPISNRYCEDCQRDVYIVLKLSLLMR
jgi:hypothetical protein